MKSTSCLGAFAALTVAAFLAGEAKAQTPYDYVYWPFFYHVKPVPPRSMARPQPMPQRRTVADNSIRPLMTFSPSLIFGVGY